MGISLLARYAIISTALQLACAWEQTFQLEWPLADAFELADTVEVQLFNSLGILLRNVTFDVTLCHKNTPVGTCFVASRYPLHHPPLAPNVTFEVTLCHALCEIALVTGD